MSNEEVSESFMMFLTLAAIIIPVVIFFGWYFKARSEGIKSEGEVNPEIAEIRKYFDKLLNQTREGMALAVYKDGQLVADLWGGYAERDALRLWEKDTMTVVFSSTKAVGALIIAILVSRKQLRYDDLVTKYWPEFGRHGKENITIQWIVEHKAGIIKFDGDIKLSQGNDHKHISKLIEETKPVWPPGTATGYHAITYGWLLDQIVRRADPKQRGIGDFYREEIQPLMKDKDFYIGLPREEHARVARLVQPTSVEFLKAMIFNPALLAFTFRSLLSRISGPNLMATAAGYPRWMSVVDPGSPYNNPRVREVENVSALGIGTARGLANVAATIMQNNLISATVWEKLSKPTEFTTDIVGHLDAHRGYGFFYEPHPTRKGEFLPSHQGVGMQYFIFDPETKISIALVRNSLLWDTSVPKIASKITEIVFKGLGKQ